MPDTSTVKKRNFYIPYIKGWAILSIMLIHLLDWSNLALTKNELVLKEFLYPGVLFFIASAGSVIYIAYGHYDSLRKPTWKLFKRGLQLIGVYYLYNLVKFFIYNFSQEPFYERFSNADTLNPSGILALKSFTAPITILFTIGALLLLAPPLLLLIKKTRWPKISLGAVILIVALINWQITLPGNAAVNFLYAWGNVTFPVMLWLVPFLIGLFLALCGFEKHKGKFLLLFAALTALTYFYLPAGADYWRPSWNMYPLKLYYVFFSFALMYALIWLFQGLEKINWTPLRRLLALIRFWGDHTLPIYLYHWIVVDLALWYFFPRASVIWLVVPLFLIGYTTLHYKKLTKYFAGEY